MDELLNDFLVETAESIEHVDAELLDFEKHPDDQEILRRIFRLVHTIKGTCGFLDLPRLEALTHAAENLMGQYRDGAPVLGDGVETILNSIDRVKSQPGLATTVSLKLPLTLAVVPALIIGVG